MLHNSQCWFISTSVEERYKCPEHLSMDASRRHPKQMSEPPQLAPLHAEEQQLNSKFPQVTELLALPLRVPKPSYPTEETHFGHWYPQPCSFGHFPNLMTVGGHWNVDR